MKMIYLLILLTWMLFGICGVFYVDKVQRNEMIERVIFFIGEKEVAKLGKNFTEHEALLRWAEMNENFGQGRIK